MIISYNWLHEYLPVGQAGLPEKIELAKLSKILTSIGLEVETMGTYESIKGGLLGLVIGEVLECEKHPGADKLTITKVDTGDNEPLQIVCGAPNVAIGQKVIVATVGSTLYPAGGEPMTMKKARIRGVESQGMICAEDEIGIGHNHAGIMVLPDEVNPGTAAADYFQPYEDVIFEIGLTPNRIDAMSHLGVAQDVCAYLSHHNKKEITVKSPFKNNFKVDHQGLQMEVTIENPNACRRYSGVSIQGIVVADSPKWLQQRLQSIGLKSINNIVDITNFILHETGQPLHAFDAEAIKGRKVIVKNLTEGTTFLTLDDKERKLSVEDLMICNEQEPMCIAGVYGGLHSGISSATKDIFLESAWFDPVITRKTSLRHGLRTDAAARFEKGVDISNTVNVLKRAAMMIKEIAGGEIASDITDSYPAPKGKTEVALKNHYLKKLSGKNYHGDTIKNILASLGFELLKESADEIRVAVPYSKPDVSIPADIVEEIMRIDGLDNVDIPTMITIAPAMETLAHEYNYKEKAAQYLSATGFNEIFTNSITNSAFYKEETLQHTVKMINNLSDELNVMRPEMMQTGLESVAWNLNRKNNDLQFYEFGKTYEISGTGKYKEKNHLAVYISGRKNAGNWKIKSDKADFFYLKGILEKIMELLGLIGVSFTETTSETLNPCLQAKIKNDVVATMGVLNGAVLARFDIKQAVLYADLDWDRLTQLNRKSVIRYVGIPKYPAVQRDLAIVVDRSMKYEAVEKATQFLKLNKLKSINLFDVFESENLGINKKSMAVSFTFLDEEKTLTDIEVENMMNQIITAYKTELNAEIRK